MEFGKDIKQSVCLYILSYLAAAKTTSADHTLNKPYKTASHASWRKVPSNEGPCIAPDHTFTRRPRLLYKTPHDTNEGYVYKFLQDFCWQHRSCKARCYKLDSANYFFVKFQNEASVLSKKIKTKPRQFVLKKSLPALLLAPFSLHYHHNLGSGRLGVKLALCFVFLWTLPTLAWGKQFLCPEALAHWHHTSDFPQISFTLLVLVLPHVTWSHKDEKM